MNATTLCYLIIGCYGMSIITLSNALPHLHSGYGLSGAYLGSLFTVLQGMYLIFSVSGGTITGYLGWRRTLTASGVLVALGCLSFFSSRVYWLFLISSFLIGSGGGLLSAQANAAAALLNPGREGTVINRSQVSFGLGAILASLSATLAPDNLWPWTFALTAFIALMISGSFHTRKDLEDLPLPHRSAGHDTPAYRIGWPFILISSAMFFYSVTEVSYWGWLPTYLTDTDKTGLLEPGMISVSFWLIFTLGRLLASKLVSEWGSLRLMSLCTPLTLAALALFPLQRNPVMIIAVAAIASLTMAPMWPTIVGRSAESTGPSASHLIGVVVGLGGLGGALGPLMVGAALDKYGMRNSFFILLFPAALTTLAIMGTSWVSRIRKGH